MLNFVSIFDLNFSPFCRHRCQRKFKIYFTYKLYAYWFRTRLRVVSKYDFKGLIKLLPSVPKQLVSIQVDIQAIAFPFFIKNISQLFALNQSVHFIVNLRDTVVDWLRTLTIFSILIRRQFKCSNTGSRSDMLSYLRTTSIFTVSLHQANRDL